MEEQRENKKKDPRQLVCGILFAFAGLCLVAVIAIILMFPNSFKGGNTGNDPTGTKATISTQIQYEQVDLQTMLDELKTNALRAEETYQDKYIEITGEIRSFDSDGKYITIIPCGASDWSLENVQCYITDPTHKSFLLEKDKGDVVTIRGKVFSIGEVIGYHVRIAEISD